MITRTETTRRIILSSSVGTATVNKRPNDFCEYVVKFTFISPGSTSDYFTTDIDDAIATAESVLAVH